MKRKKIDIIDIVVYFVVTLFTVATIYPFINMMAVSISSSGAYFANPMMVIPKDLNFESYEIVFSSNLIFSSYKNTIITTLVGTAISMFLTITIAYPLSCKRFKAKSFIVYMMVVTMLFNGGLIPNFYLVKYIGLYNTLWALMIPGALSTFNAILMINFFKNIPDELEEAARMDGASDIYILVRLIIPLSIPIIATLSLFYAVGRWNAFFNAIVYIRDRNKWTLQLLLREVLMQNAAIMADGSVDPAMKSTVPAAAIRYATIVTAVVPILCVYPFIQKYFVKGIMIGAVKG